MSNFTDRIEIGRTGLSSARLGIGSTFDAPATAIEAAFERGINYLYWGSIRQPEFAKAMVNLSKAHRDELILTIQSYSQEPETIEGEVAEAIRAAGVDSFDFLLLGNRLEKPDERYLEVFEGMKSKGMVRYLSISSHNRPLVPEVVDDYVEGASPYDLVMFRYNAVHRGAERDVFPRVPPQPRPTMATYTATRWGHLLDPEKVPPGEAPVSARDCYRYSLSNPGIDMVICGPANADQLDEAISALEAGPIDDEERARIERIGAHLYGQYAPAYPDQGDASDVEAGVAATEST